MSRKNRISPLDEAASLGQILSWENVHRTVVEKIVKEYAFRLYHKPRATAYRKRWMDAAMRGYDSTEKLKTLSS